MSADADGVIDRLQDVRRRLKKACEDAGRDPQEVELLAVSKGHPPGHIKAAWDAGQRLFGENYVQEWLQKAEHPTLLGLDGLNWHFIGALQRNKIRFLLGRVHCIETVDRERLAVELSRRSIERAGGRAQEVLVEVNLGNESSKAGYRLEQLESCFGEILALEGISISGFMSIPKARRDPEASRVDHRALRQLRDRLQDRYGTALPTLSMGMSSDFETAISEGSTRVRIGTAIFGQRTPASRHANV